MLSKILQRRFTVYSNQAQQMIEHVNGREIVYDHNVEAYDKCIQAYLYRRRIKKEEIAPKIYINEGLKGVDLSSQKLVPLSNLYSIDQMKSLYEKDNKNSSYIISKLQEDHFKQIMDEYTKKIPINGYVVPLNLYQNYETLRNNVVDLYRQFFFGNDNQTAFERDTEFRYLIQKLDKFQKYQAKSNVRYKCTWTLSNQRRQELLKNWKGRDSLYYDDSRPIYESLYFDKKQQIDQLTEKINDTGFSLREIARKVVYYVFERGMFSKSSRRRYELICTMLLMRTIVYTNSTEFSTVMSIPADFYIEHSILNMHIWLLADRLNQINTKISRFMSKQLLITLKKHQLQSISRIHLKKKNDFIKDVVHYMQANRNLLSNHVYSSQSSTNPNSIYNKLDALVWSIIFFEKVPRYSNEVYMMADYFKQHIDYLKTCTMKDFEEGLIEFDCYRIETDFVHKVQKHSPRLSEDEFQEEFHSEKSSKKYYYSYNQGNQSSSQNQTSEYKQ